MFVSAKKNTPDEAHPNTANVNPNNSNTNEEWKNKQPRKQKRLRLRLAANKNTNPPTPTPNPNGDPNANNSNTHDEWNKQPKQQKPKRLRLLLGIGCIVVALVVLQYTTKPSSVAAGPTTVPTSTIRQAMMTMPQQEQSNPNNSNNTSNTLTVTGKVQSNSSSTSSSSPLPLSKHPPLPLPVPGPPVPGPSSSSSSPPPQRDTSIVADGVEDQERSSNNNNNNDQKDPQQPQPQTKVMNDRSSSKIKIKNKNNNSHIDNNDCWMSSSFSYNSKEWLQGPRLGNIQLPDDDDNDDNNMMRPSSFLLSSSWMLDLVTPVADKNINTSNKSNDILTNNIQQLLKQTICHETSNFVDLLDEEQEQLQQLQQLATNKDTDDVKEEEDDDDDPLVIQMWTMRFIYLAVYHHQHRHAIPEYHERKKNSSCRTEDHQAEDHGQQHGGGGVVDNFDYECKDTKFLVVPLSNHGLGSVFRLGATNAILTGLAVNRTVLFVNGVDRPMPPLEQQQQQLQHQKQSIMNNGYDEFHSSLTTSWKVVSCPRKDYQCFFQPITPCVISQQEYQLAPMILHPNLRGPLHTLFDYDHTRIYEKERVVILKLGDVNKAATNYQSIVLQQLATEILQSLVIDVNPNDPRIPLFQKAIDAIQPDRHVEGGGQYPGSTSIMKRAILFYLMRPNPEYAEKLKTIMIPIQQQHAYDEKSASTAISYNNRPVTFGLPIRASDKCNTESECLTFVQYMKLLYETLKNGFLDLNDNKTQHQQLNQNHRPPAAAGRPQSQELPPLSPPIINILLTSESQSVFDEKEFFLQNFTHHHHQQQQQQQQDVLNHDDRSSSSSSYYYTSSSSSFIDSIRFISNDNDIRQGSGAVGTSSKKEIQTLNITADDILLSAISSIQTQLLGSQYTIGNCCSNFHNLIFDFLRGGCGNAVVKMVEEEEEEEEGDGNNNGNTKPRRKKKKKKRRRTVTTTQCLQNHPNPEFAVCCWPRKSPVCPRMRLERLAEYKLNHSSSSSWSIV